MLSCNNVAWKRVTGGIASSNEPRLQYLQKVGCGKDKEDVGFVSQPQSQGVGRLLVSFQNVTMAPSSCLNRAKTLRVS